MRGTAPTRHARSREPAILRGTWEEQIAERLSSLGLEQESMLPASNGRALTKKRHLLAGQTGQAGRRSSPRSSIRSCTHLIAELWPQAQVEHAYEASRAAADQRSRLMAAGASSRRRSSPSQQGRPGGKRDHPGMHGPLHVDARVLMAHDVPAKRIRERYARAGPAPGGSRRSVARSLRCQMIRGVRRCAHRALGRRRAGPEAREAGIGVIRGPPRSAPRDHGRSRPHRRDRCRRVRGRRERYVDRRPERGWRHPAAAHREAKPRCPTVGLAAAGDSRRPRTRPLRSPPPL